MVKRRIRVLLSKVGLDGHDVGIRVLASSLRNSGMEVVYLGRYQTPESIVKAAVQEDVDVIGVSILSGTQLVAIPKIMKLIKEESVSRPLVLVGGIFPEQDIRLLKEFGVDEVFMGSLTDPVIDYIKSNVKVNNKA